MLLFIFALTAANPPAGQTLAGPAFETFAHLADRHCPSRLLREVTLGDLSWEQESFGGRLSAEQSKRLSLADSDRGCAGNGLSCPTTRTLAAMQRSGIMSSFVRYASANPAPTGVIREPASAARAVSASDILQNLDLGSFGNSAGSRRLPRRHRPSDYGFTKSENFPDGWAQLSEPGDRWYISALLLDNSTICFMDAGGNGASYRATRVLRVSPGHDGRWTAVQIADRSDCRNEPPFHETAVAFTRLPPPSNMAGEFGLLCLDASSSAEGIRRRAVDDGWQQSDDRGVFTKQSHDGMLTLKVTDGRSAGETQEVCSVGVTHAIATTVRSAQALLGFKPALDFGTSATFFAVRNTIGWRSGANFNKLAFQKAKREGNFYSVLAHTGDNSSQMIAMHVLSASN